MILRQRLRLVDFISTVIDRILYKKTIIWIKNNIIEAAVDILLAKQIIYLRNRIVKKGRHKYLCDLF